jgi:seryl-tRNA synthetase
MFDIKFVRENLEIIKKTVQVRGMALDLDRFARLDEERRKALVEVEGLKSERNKASEEVARKKKEGKGDGALKETYERLRRVGERIKGLDEKVKAVDIQLAEILQQIPNIPHPDTPIGKDETENKEIGTWGEKRKFAFQPKPHWEVGEKLGILDFQRAAKISGARFYIMKGLGAKLERALIDYMIEVHTQEHGYTEIFPPFLVNRDSMFGTGHLPLFEEDMYRTDPDDMFLVPTAEVPVTNMHRDETFEPGRLPVKYVSFTACFRREAGAAGKDTRGVVRVHQFDKVELVKFVEPGKSYEELESLLENALVILRRLNLPYRVLKICTGDLGFKATMQYDPEVWCPGQNRYVEISSCSNFEAFQARRMNIHYRPSSGARAEFVHTLNGSGLAVGRTLAAILENYQEEDGSVAVPEVLRSRMRVDRIT